MQDYFKNIPEIQFEGENSDNPLAFKFNSGVVLLAIMSTPH